MQRPSIWMDGCYRRIWTIWIESLEHMFYLPYHHCRCVSFSLICNPWPRSSCKLLKMTVLTQKVSARSPDRLTLLMSQKGSISLFYQQIPLIVFFRSIECAVLVSLCKMRSFLCVCKLRSYSVANLNRIKLQNTIKFAFSSSQRCAGHEQEKRSHSFQFRGHKHTYRPTDRQTILILRTLLYCSGHRVMFIVHRFFRHSASTRGSGAPSCKDSETAPEWVRALAWLLYKTMKWQNLCLARFFFLQFFLHLA